MMMIMMGKKKKKKKTKNRKHIISHHIKSNEKAGNPPLPKKRNAYRFHMNKQSKQTKRNHILGFAYGRFLVYLGRYLSIISRRPRDG